VTKEIRPTGITHVCCIVKIGMSPFIRVQLLDNPVNNMKQTM